MAPMDVPAMILGRKPSSSKASSTGMCASPRAPPPPSARAMLGESGGGDGTGTGAGLTGTGFLGMGTGRIR